MQLGHYEDSVTSFDKAIVIKPVYYEAWSNRGLALLYLKRLEEAIASFDKSLEINPDDSSTVYNKACCLSLMGDRTSALHWLKKAITLDAKYRDMAKSDDDFAILWDDEQFQTLIQ